MKLVIATGNAGKLDEIRKIIGGSDMEIVSAKDLGISLDVEENGSSFRENALIKAKACAKEVNEAVLADDSGLCIDALGGEPGIYSSRYLGEDTSYDIKNKDILRRMKDVPDGERSARFVCDVAVIFPDGRQIVTEGIMEGEIAHEICGENGFGYDPVFYLSSYGKTSAEIAPDEKNKISHRAKALAKMKDELSLL